MNRGAYTLTMHDFNTISFPLGESKMRLWHHCKSHLFGFSHQKPGIMIVPVEQWLVQFWAERDISASSVSNKSETGPTLLLWLKSLTRPSEHASRGYLITGHCLLLCLFWFLWWYFDGNDQGEELNSSESVLSRSKGPNNVTLQVALRQF